MDDKIFSIIESHHEDERSEKTSYVLNRIEDDLMDYAIFQILSELGEEEKWTDKNVKKLIRERFPKHKEEVLRRIEQLDDIFDNEEEESIYAKIYYGLYGKYS